MSIELVVTQPFADYARGNRITDPAKIAAVLLHHEHRVVKVAVPDAPPAPPPAPAPAPAPAAPPPPAPPPALAPVKE
jgi:hypothetical protein